MNIQYEGKILDIKKSFAIQELDAADGNRAPGMEQLRRAVIHLGQTAKKSASAFKELASKAEILSGQFEHLLDSMEVLRSGTAERQLMAAVDHLSCRRTGALITGIVALDMADNGGNGHGRYAAAGAARGSRP